MKLNLVICSLILAVAMTGLLWLAIGLGLILAGYKLLEYFSSNIKNPTLREFAKKCFTVVCIAVLSMGLKLYVLDVYKIPSKSMEQTLLPNDIILVNKLSFGPKLITNPFEISWVSFFLKQKGFQERKLKESKRLKGLGSVHRGDVFVYIQPLRDFFVVKRCVAISGDTLRLRNGEIYVNNILSKALPNIKYKYSLKFSQKKLFFKLFDSLKAIKTIEPDFASLSLKGDFTLAEIRPLRERTHLQIIRLLSQKTNNTPSFLNQSDTLWTIDNFGPLVVPAKSRTIRLTDKNYIMYRKLFDNFEQVKIRKKGTRYLVDGKETTHYTFKENYFFVMGDNRYHSEDSRYIGFIPERNIIGKAVYILLSTNRNKFRWKRVLKGIE